MKQADLKNFLLLKIVRSLKFTVDSLYLTGADLMNANPELKKILALQYGAFPLILKMRKGSVYTVDDQVQIGWYLPRRIEMTPDPSFASLHFLEVVSIFDKEYEVPKVS